jgi:hypothetical protein
LIKKLCGAVHQSNLKFRSEQRQLLTLLFSSFVFKIKENIIDYRNKEAV